MARKKTNKKTNGMTNKMTNGMTNKMTNEPEITLNTYLSNYSRKRNLDNVIKKWYMRKDKTNKKRTVKAWNKIINSFFTETEK